VNVTFEIPAPESGELPVLALVSAPLATIGTLEPGACVTVSWNVLLTDSSPLAVGSAAVYSLALSSSAGPGPIANGTLEVNPVAETFAQWITGYPGAAFAAGFDDDADLDQYSNALERYLGSDPSGPGRVHFAMTPEGTGLPKLLHSRAGRPGTDSAPAYEWSLDLASWQPAGGSIGALTVNLRPRVVSGMGNGDQMIEVTPEVEGAENPGSLFLRLGVAPIVAPTPETAPVAPQITSQPQGGNYDFESEVILQVEATGTGPLLHQWFLNGEPLDGEISPTLVIPSLNYGMTGNYSVRILGPGGIVTSGQANVRVNRGGGTS